MNKRHLFLALGFVSFSVSMDSELTTIESGVHTKCAKTIEDLRKNLELARKKNPPLSFQQKRTTELIAGTSIASFIVGCGIWWAGPVVTKEGKIIWDVIFKAPYSG